jgi:hypothetical protein
MECSDQTNQGSYAAKGNKVVTNKKLTMHEPQFAEKQTSAKAPLLSKRHCGTPYPFYPGASVNPY